MRGAFQTALRSDIARKGVAVRAAQVIRRRVRIIAGGLLHAIVGATRFAPIAAAAAGIETPVVERLTHTRSHAGTWPTKETECGPRTILGFDVAMPRYISGGGNAAAADARLQPEPVNLRKRAC